MRGVIRRASLIDSGFARKFDIFNAGNPKYTLRKVAKDITKLKFKHKVTWADLFVKPRPEALASVTNAGHSI